MKQTIIPIIFTVLAFLVACNKENIITTAETDVPVVEAYLEPGKEVVVNLSKMVPFTEEEFSGSLTIDSAEVYIKYNEIEYLLEPVSDDPGKYVSQDSNLVVLPGNDYALSFDYNGHSVTSTTSIPTRPINTSLNPSVLYIDPYAMGPGMSQNKVAVYWDNPDNIYHLIIIEYMESSYDPISPNLDPESFDQYRKVSTKPVLETSYDLDTRRQLAFFGTYKIIIYKVNEEYVNLHENISQSSLNLTEALTNIENGLGIFTGINSDILFLEVVKI